MKDATDEIDERLANLDSYIEKSKTKKTKPKSKSEKIAERLKQEHDKPIEVKTKQNNKVDVNDKDDNDAKVIEKIRKESIIKLDIRPQITQLMFVKANNVVNIEQLKEEMLNIGIKVIEYTDVLPTMFNLHYNKEK